MYSQSQFALFSDDVRLKIVKCRLFTTEQVKANLGLDDLADQLGHLLGFGHNGVVISGLDHTHEHSGRPLFILHKDPRNAL